MGRRQANALAARLAAMRPTHLYCSPAIRCLQTAQPVAAAAGLRGRTVPWLSELGCLWRYAGPAPEEMATRFPALAAPEPPSEEAWGGARMEGSDDRGVSHAAVRARAAAVTGFLLHEHPRTSANRVCLCTHAGFGGFAYALLPTLLGNEESAPGVRGAFDLDNASLTVVDCSAEWNTVVRANCTRHLAGLVAAVCADPGCGYATDTVILSEVTAQHPGEVEGLHGCKQAWPETPPDGGCRNVLHPRRRSGWEGWRGARRRPTPAGGGAPGQVCADGGRGWTGEVTAQHPRGGAAEQLLSESIWANATGRTMQDVAFASHVLTAG